MIIKEVNNKVKVLRENDFKLEKHIQSFFENNLNEILGIKFVATEFTVDDFRIDTLAFDEESKSFRILEFKNIKNHSLFDQGITYLNILFDRKADFVLKYNEVFSKNLSIKDIDWTQSRIIFVSPIYSKYQLSATRDISLPFDLYKVTKYEEGIYNIEKQEKGRTSNINSMLDIPKPKVLNEVKVYTEEDHLNNRDSNVRELYSYIKDKMLESDNIDIDVKKVYIAFKGKTNIVDIVFANHLIKAIINMKKGLLNDPLNKTVDVSETGHWGNGHYSIDIKNKEDADYFLTLFNQSLEINKK